MLAPARRRWSVDVQGATRRAIRQRRLSLRKAQRSVENSWGNRRTENSCETVAILPNCRYSRAAIGSLPPPSRDDISWNPSQLFFSSLLPASRVWPALSSVNSEIKSKRNEIRGAESKIRKQGRTIFFLPLFPSRIWSGSGCTTPSPFWSDRRKLRTLHYAKV